MLFGDERAAGLFFASGIAVGKRVCFSDVTVSER